MASLPSGSDTFEHEDKKSREESPEDSAPRAANSPSSGNSGADNFLAPIDSLGKIDLRFRRISRLDHREL